MFIAFLHIFLSVQKWMMILLNAWMETARFKVVKVVQKGRFSTFCFQQPILFVTKKEHSQKNNLIINLSLNWPLLWLLKVIGWFTDRENNVDHDNNNDDDIYDDWGHKWWAGDNHESLIIIITWFFCKQSHSKLMRNWHGWSSNQTKTFMAPPAMFMLIGIPKQKCCLTKYKHLR